MKHREIMGLVDALIVAVKRLHYAEESGSDADYECADINVDRARADVSDALLVALQETKKN